MNQLKNLKYMGFYVLGRIFFLSDDFEIMQNGHWKVELILVKKMKMH